jgi:hypothetical protein
MSAIEHEIDAACNFAPGASSLESFAAAVLSRAVQRRASGTLGSTKSIASGAALSTM